MENHLAPGTRKIADDLFMVTLPMPFRLEHVNIYALLENGELSLFDTGGNFPGTFAALEGFLEEIGSSVRRVRRIFITHYHADHCGIAGLIKEKSGASIFMSETDFETIRSFEQMEMRIQHIQAFCAEQGLDARTIRSIAGLFKGFKGMTCPFQADRFLSDGDVFAVGRKTVQALATPGHSRGHFSFFIPEDGILIAGDNLLPHITPNLSPDLLAPSYRPLKSFLASLDKISRLPVTNIYPAHGLPFSDLRARVEEIKAHHRERKTLTLRALAGYPRTAVEVSVEVFGSDLPEFDKLLALNETYVHLLELEDEGVVRRYREAEKVFFTLA